MALSGTYDMTSFTAQDMVDNAFRRARVPVVKVTSEMIQTALTSLDMMLKTLANKGVPLWCIEKLIVPLYYGKGDVTLPSRVVGVENANLRQLTRQEGVVNASAGTPPFATDDDFETICNAGVGGNISIEFTGPTRITNVGILPGASAQWTLVFETSNDGIAWTTVLAPGQATYTDREWTWYDIDGAVPATYIRVRAAGPADDLSVREFFVGNSQNEIPFGRNNRDDYWAFPNKTFLGRPTEYWFDRQRDAPVMHLWPVPAYGFRYYQMVLAVHRYVMDVGAFTNKLDLPIRWYESITWMLAWRIYVNLPEETAKGIDLQYVTGVLKPSADEAEKFVQDEERDNSVTRWVPDISPYTR